MTLLVESLLTSTVRVVTLLGEEPLTNASGFLFERDKRLYLVTSRHVLVDAPSNHYPDRLEFNLHLDTVDLTNVARVSTIRVI